VSAPVFLCLTTKGHAKLLHCCCTPIVQAPPLAFAYTCMAVEVTRTIRSHPRRLHAHAAHRVPTARADRPSCRPDTGKRPSYSCSLSVMLESPPLRHSYLELWWFQISVHQRFLDPSQQRAVLWRWRKEHSVPVSRREEVLVPTPGDGRRHHSTAPAFLEGRVWFAVPLCCLSL
jgi:hypothetical protein